MEKVRVLESGLRNLCEDIFAKAGVECAAAKTVTDVMLYADMRGVESHGVQWIPIYTKRLIAGGIAVEAVPTIDTDSKATCIVNANNGFGQVAADKAISVAIDKARDYGIAGVGVAHSNHIGAAGYYTRKAAQAGFISIVCGNTTPLMPPWGGKELRLGSNPLSIGIPVGDNYPMIIDMATSAGARGKLFIAEKKGEKIPWGWALDSEGRPTDNPTEAIKGFLLPMAGPKGYGLSLAIDVLGGVLTGSLFGKHIPPLFGKPEVPQNVGHFVIAVNIEHFIDKAYYNQQMEKLIEGIKEVDRLPSVDKIYLPGEIEYLQYLENKEKGIPLAPKTLAEIEAAAEQLGLNHAGYALRI
ncbi:MAG: Ldh family oxidoreductase [Anaerolineaceae bacterium]|nr:Ldh family oxidoreductase [Anaerolineaceae bacterium]